MPGSRVRLETSLGNISLELFDGVEAGDLEGSGFSPEEAADVIQRYGARSL